MLNNVNTPDIKNIIEGKGKIEDPIKEDKSSLSSQPQEQLVRYKKDETVKDLDGNTVNMPKLPGMKWAGFGEKDIPIKAKEGEPANAEEYVNDLAKLIWDSGKSGEDAYKSMRKKYRASSALIDKDDATFNDKTIPEEQKKYQYYLKQEGSDGKESYYISPLEAAEIKVAKDHGLDLEQEGRLLAQIREGHRPSTASRIINRNKKLKENWEKVLSNPRDLDAVAAVSESLRELKGNYRNYRLYGFDTRDEFNQYIDYIGKSLGNILNKSGAGEAEHDNENKDKVEETTTKTTAKPAATAATAATTPSPAVKAEDDKDQKDYKTWEAEHAEKVKVQDEVLDEKEDALDKVLERAKIRRGELDEEWDKLLEDNEKELDRHKDVAELSDFLPRFAIQHYLEGDFGERKTAKALGTLGYFLLDKIGASLVNASQVARGLSPTQKTALEQYNTKMMEAAINRDDKNRSKINEEKINTVIKNSDALRAAGYDTEVKLTNDMVSKYLEQHADQVDELAYLKLKKQAAEWYDNLTDAEKMEVDRLFLAMSTNPDERQRGILQYQISGYEVLGQTDETKKQQAKYAQAEAKAKTKTIERLTRAQAARAEQEIENMKKDGKLTEAQAADAWKQVEIHQKDLDWRDAQEWQKQVTGYIKPIVDLIPGK